jgi:putative membrane protein
MRTKKSFLGITFRGLAMGAADVVPGVSGGTIAFITGIYEELIDTISGVNLSLLKTLKNEGLKSFWKQLNGNFFVALFLGIGISIVSLAKVISYLLETHPILVWSFFFGLVLASIHLVGKQVKRWNIATVIAFVLGAGIAFWITILPPMQQADANWYIFISGVIAICAMILPGISGSFILLLLGSYQTILNAVKEFDIPKIVIFASGCVVGLLSFSHLLKWMFKKFEGITIALLTGFLLGSLNKLWPWKETLLIYTNSHGKVIPLEQKNILPAKFESITGLNNQLMFAVLLCLVGIILIFTLEKFGNKGQNNS